MPNMSAKIVEVDLLSPESLMKARQVACESMVVDNKGILSLALLSITLASGIASRLTSTQSILKQ
jgi:hypothetical protein